MGAIARVIKAETGEDSETENTVELHYNENKYCDHYGPSGDDSPALPEDRVALMEVEGTGAFVSVGVLSKSQGAKPGEKLIYSRDANGNVTAKIHLKNDGTIDVETEQPVNISGSSVAINGGGAKAARVDDEVEIQIPAGSVIVAVSGGSGAPAVGTPNPSPITCKGRITTGSNTVEIG